MRRRRDGAIGRYPKTRTGLVDPHSPRDVNLLGMRSLIGLVTVVAAAGTLYASPSVVASLDAAKADSGSTVRAEANTMQQRIDEHAAHARRLATAARAESDSIKLGCVGQRAAIASRLSELGRVQMSEIDVAIRGNDDAKQALHLKQIEALAQESDVTSRETAACVGAKQVAAADDSSPGLEQPSMPSSPDPAPSVKLKKKKLDTTEGCTNLGVANCQSRPLEYIAFASPFLPD
jgi:hypothetical protein